MRVSGIDNIRIILTFVISHLRIVNQYKLYHDMMCLLKSSKKLVPIYVSSYISCINEKCVTVLIMSHYTRHHTSAIDVSHGIILFVIHYYIVSFI